jgi:hypothetical protein
MSQTYFLSEEIGSCGLQFQYTYKEKAHIFHTPYLSLIIANFCSFITVKQY